MTFEELAKKRYAVKLFDKQKKLTQEQVDYVIDMAILAPTSFGLQPFRIKVVSDDATKEKLQVASWNQPQITSCSHLLVFCADNSVMDRIEKFSLMLDSVGFPAEKKDVYVGMMRNSFENKTPQEVNVWASKQTYLAADHTMLAAVEKGFNSCPMEGFDSNAYRDILGLPENLTPSIIVPLGYPADEPRGKIRFSKEEILL